MSVVCYQVEVPATDRSLVQRSPTECVSVIESDHMPDFSSQPVDILLVSGNLSGSSEAQEPMYK